MPPKVMPRRAAFCEGVEAMIRSKKITSAARGQECTLNIAGWCNYNPLTVVFCHFPDESHGMAMKSSDLSGGFGCCSCHDAVDGRVRCDEFTNHRDWYLRRSQTRTMSALVDLGVIKIA